MQSRGQRASTQRSAKPCGVPTSKGKPKPKCPPKVAQPYQGLPAFSVPLPVPTQAEQMKAKQKIMRRNKPEGEDLRKMKQIMRSIGDTRMSVYEFIGLIGPSTADNGDTMRNVLADELNVFRTSTRKIYEQMTSDIGDVLTNEHIQLKDYTEERFNVLEERMQRNLADIYEMCPGFDFDQFFTQEGYLEEMLPVPEEEDENSDQRQALLRQEAYQRYQWLRSEGDRLKDENARLQKRLTQLRRKQAIELRAVAERELQAEEDRKILEAHQEELEDQLEKLNESVARSLVVTEFAHAEPMKIPPQGSKPTMKQQLQARQKIIQQPEWSAKQAAEIEASKLAGAVHAETSKVTVRTKTARSRAATAAGKQRRKKQPQSPQRQPDYEAAFHYSPVKTPPRPSDATEGLPAPPFHYSPPRSPARPPPGAAATAPYYYSPSRSPQQMVQAAAGPYAQPARYDYEPRPGRSSGYEDMAGASGGYEPVARPSRGYERRASPSSGYQRRASPNSGYEGLPGPSSGYEGLPGPSSGYERRASPSSGYQRRASPNSGYEGLPGPSSGYEGLPGASSGYERRASPSSGYARRASPSSGYEGLPAPIADPRVRVTMTRTVTQQQPQQQQPTRRVQGPRDTWGGFY